MKTMRLIDFISGRNTCDYYAKYLRTQWYSQEEMYQYRLGKLRKLLEHCYRNVPYYTEIMKAKGISPSDVKDFFILERFPVLTKELIKENYAKFTPLNESSIMGIKSSQTGGTTGNILNKRNDAQTRSSVWGSYQRFYDWMGIRSNDRVLTYWGGHVIKHGVKGVITKAAINLLRNTYSFDAYDTRPETFELIASTIKSKNIQLIRSYPQALYTLALKLKSMGFRFSVKAIMTTSEPIMPQHRDLFREVFGAESYDQYGCGEIGGIAYECSEHKGLHVTEERVILETNANNELLITDLDNFAMPFIRYWNADQALLSDSACACGRKSQVLDKVMGRTCDYLIGIDGQTLHWAYFWHLLFDTEIAIKRSFIKFQVVQKSKDLILFRTVSEPLSDEDKDILVQMIRGKMGNMKVEFSQEQDIENTASGKFRPVINELL